MKARLLVLTVVFAASSVFAAAMLAPLSGTSFHDFTVGASVDGQDGWNVFLPGNCGFYDESVVNFGANRVWRVSNAVTCGSFGDQPFAPRPGGLPNDTVNDPDNSEPFFFAGENSTGAAFRTFSGQFSFRSATGATQPGLRITVSADSGQGGRQSFAALVDTGSGINVETFDLDNAGNFIGPITISQGLSYTDWHTLNTEVIFKRGPRNDKVRYFVDGRKRHTGQSWEQFYRNFQAALHPLGVPVQTLLFRVSGTAAPAVAGGGFLIDNVFTAVSEDRGDDDHDHHDD